MHIIGRGRFGRETYPIGPRSNGPTGPTGPSVPGSGIIQMGFDSLVQGGNTLPADTGNQTVIVDAVDRPIRVTLPGVQNGNYIEILWNVTVEVDQNSGSGSFGVVPIVTFDGSTVVPGTFSYVRPGPGASGLQQIDGTFVNDSVLSINGMALIPATAGDLVVELVYASSVDVVMVGWGDPPLPLAGSVACGLIVKEISGTIVKQIPADSPLSPMSA